MSDLPSQAIPKCVMFDLDNTLAKSKQSLDETMAQTLTKLLKVTNVAITSGGKLEQLVKQVDNQLGDEACRERLFLLPTSGASLYVHTNNTWTRIYEETLSPKEEREIANAIKIANDTTHTVDFNQRAYGERIEFRGAQVSFSALGQEAPLDKKLTWDKTRAKREAFRARLAPILKNYTVRIGGTTTIDITKKGIDKAYGVRKLSEYLSIPIKQMLYVGDELKENGNDEVVISTGIKTHPVTSPDDTRDFIKQFILHI